MEAEPGTTHLSNSDYKGFQVNPPLAPLAPPIDPLESNHFLGVSTAQWHQVGGHM